MKKDISIPRMNGSSSELERLSAYYAQLSDAELKKVGSQYDSLTMEAQSAIHAEFDHRGIPAPELPDNGDPEFQPLVTIRSFRDLPEAQLAKSALESAGLAAFLQDENLVRTDWFLSNAIGRIRLQVRQKDAADAEEVLSQPIPSMIESDSGDYQQPRCPSCRSLDIGRPFAQPFWSCNACGAKWEELADDNSAAPKN